MFSKYIQWLFIYLFVCGSTTLHAQDTIPRWSLQTCLDYAKQHNITLNTLRLNQSISEQNLLLSRSAVLPGVSATLSPSVTHEKVTNTSGNISDQVVTSGNTSASASMTLYNGGYLRNDIKQKDLLVKIAGLDIAASENDITLSITQAYLNILLAQENIVYQKDVVTTSQAQVDQEQHFYDVGSAALKDLIQLQATLANDKYTLVTAENTHRQNLLTLKQILQLPADTPFAVVEPDTIMANPTLTSLQDARQTALANRPEVKSSELGVESARLDVLKARAGYLPVLTAGAAIGSSYTTLNDYSFMKQMDNNFYQQIGLTLSVPIFSRRANKVNEAIAKYEVGQAELTLLNTRTTLSYEVEQAYINVLNAQSQYDAAVEQLRFAKESYRIANEQLKIGAVNATEVLVQKNLYIQALQAYVQAKYSAALYIRIYDFYRGIPVTL